MSVRLSCIFELIDTKGIRGWRVINRASGNSPLSTISEMPVQNVPQSIIENFTESLGRNSIADVFESGRIVATQLFPKNIFDLINSADGGDILFRVPAEWADVPFELCDCGSGFIGQLFAVGTIIGDSISSANSFASVNDHAEVLFVATTDGTPAAAVECGSLSAMFRRRFASARNAVNPSIERLLAVLSQSGFAHIAGHASVEGLHLSDGVLQPEKIAALKKSPAMVFINACSAGKLGGAGMSGLAGAFLSVGSQIVIAPFVPVRDVDAHNTATGFYKLLLDKKGMAPAEAIRRIRLTDAKAGLINSLVCRIFGDPLTSLPLPKTASKKFPLILGAVIVVVIAVTTSVITFLSTQSETAPVNVLAKSGEKRFAEIVDSCRSAGSLSDSSTGRTLRAKRNAAIVLSGLDSRRFVSTPACGYYYYKLDDASFVMIQIDTGETRALLRLSQIADGSDSAKLVCLALRSEIFDAADAQALIFKPAALLISGHGLVECENGTAQISGLTKWESVVNKEMKRESAQSVTLAGRDPKFTAIRFVSSAAEKAGRRDWEKLLASDITASGDEIGKWWIALSSSDSGFIYAAPSPAASSHFAYVFVQAADPLHGAALRIEVESDANGIWRVCSVSVI